MIGQCPATASSFMLSDGFQSDVDIKKLLIPMTFWKFIVSLFKVLDINDLQLLCTPLLLFGDDRAIRQKYFQRPRYCLF